ncbi:DNA-directed RNA polymerase III subunit rpc3 [Golovinomyces cichoracearum]|uniref:DNA-directed RNA polymerase III subunit RPC3 n=1 Tax=Golovinomyces cichoracearum TaxID=62708 RepID=A0A420IY56_9PEZI|nr:DNA-directed RNA polymerase III subunit rpc3 [Golovinomyces cichoracearum]
MSQSKNAIELCSLLVDEMYGELTSQIYSVLLRRGRLPIPLIAKYIHLGQRQVRHGLVVLIQQNLVYHNSDEETGLTHYEADTTTAYTLVRSGKILEAVESRYGTMARDVVQNLFLLGHTKISDLEEAYQSKQKQQISRENHHPSTSENGDINKNSKFKQEQMYTVGQLHSVLLRLLQSGVIEEVYEHMFRSPTDTYSRIEKETLQMYFGGSTKGAKQKEELKLKVRARLQALRSDTQKWQSKVKKGLHHVDFSNGVNQMNKRRKLSDIQTNDNGYDYKDDGFRLDSEMVIRVNNDKCTVFLRNQRLIVAVQDKIGVTTSLIYGEALRLLEDNISRCQMSPKIDSIGEDVNTPTFTTSQLTAAIGDHINCGSGIANIGVEQSHSRGAGKTLKPSHNQRIKYESDEDTDSNGDDEERAFDSNSGTQKKLNQSLSDFADSLGQRENKTHYVKNHLMLLAEDGFKFLRKCGSAGLGEWTVDFKETIAHLREAELDKVLLETFGTSGHRLVRILRKFGKIDEKQLPNMALMKQKDMRTKLAELQMAGIVDIQEVPKDASRTIYRTIFLWYFDTERVSESFRNNVFKTMSRALQRLDTERKKDKEVLRLTHRSDVRDQKPEDYLDKDQLSQLAIHLAKEEAILTQLTRLDELVGIFRDY